MMTNRPNEINHSQTLLNNTIYNQKLEFKELQERLKIFSEYFVNELETRLILLYKILEGNVQKKGKLSELLSNATGNTIAFIPAIFGIKLGDGIKNIVKKPIDACSEKHQKNKAFKLYDVVYDFQTNKIDRRKNFVEMAIDIFQSFEFQFMHVYSDKGSRKAMKKIAKDAAYRILKQAETNNETELTVENILTGPSKQKSISGVPISSAIKKRGVNLIYKNYDQEFEWNSSDMYENIGIIVENDLQNKMFTYYIKEKNKSSDYFAFRRPFFNENLVNFNSEYIILSELEIRLQPKFIGTSNYYKQQIQSVLDIINKNDTEFDFDKFKKLFEETKDDLMKKIELLKKTNNENDDLLNSVNKYIEQIKLDEFVENIEEYFKSISKDYENIKSTINDVEAKAQIHREKIAVENKNEHEKTRILLAEKIENCLNVHQKSGIRFAISKPVKSFVGKAEQLIQINNFLLSDPCIATLSHTVCITGLGGAGKTQLVRMYAHMYEDMYKNIIFIDAEHPTNSFIKLSDELKISNLFTSKKYENIGNIVKEIFKYFDNEEKSLFVFDNAENYSAIKYFLPIENYIVNKPHILITSRCRHWKIGDIGNIYTIHIDGFSHTEAFNYVKTALNINTADEKCINLLIEELQFLPLALKQSVGYIDQQNELAKRRFGKKFSITDYIDLYQKQKSELLNKGFYEYEDFKDKTVLTTWLVTFENIAKDENCGRTAKLILNIMAYIAPDDIFVENIFRDLLTKEPTFWDSIDLLYKYSIINIQNGISNIHRLVQEVVRLNLIKNNMEEIILEEILTMFRYTRNIFNKHIIMIWEYASKYKNLVNIFFPKYRSFMWGYTPLHLLAGYRDDYTAIANILKHTNYHNIDDFHTQFSETPLYIAAKCGHLKIVKYLYSKNAKLSPLFSNSPLHAAAYNGHHEVVRFIINKIVDYDKQYILNVAVSRCQVKVIEVLKPDNKIYILMSLIDSVKGSYNYERFKQILENVKKNINESISGEYNTQYTLLHAAAKHGSLDILDLLINNGADVDKTDQNGRTPLIESIFRKRLDIIQLLIKSEANINKADNYDNTPLSYVISIIQNINVVKYFVENGADCNLLNMCQRTFLHVAAGANAEHIFEYLLDKNIDINLKDTSGLTALHEASRYGNIKIIKLLLERGTDIDVINEEGESPMHYALYNSSYEAIKLFIEKDVNINIKNRRNESYLYCAACFDNVDIFKLILYNDVNIDAINSEGNTALHNAAFFGNENIVKLLIENCADCTISNNMGDTPLHVASFRGYSDVVELLLEETDCVDVCDRFGRTPLHKAIMFNYIPCVKLLLKSGANPNIRDNNGNAALNQASYTDNLELIKILLEYEADLNILDINDCSVMHIAAKQDNFHILELFLEKGLNPNLKNLRGRTALYYTIENNLYNSTELLLQNNIDPNVSDIIGVTPLHCACEKGFFEIVRLLIQHGADVFAVDLDGSSVFHSAMLTCNIDIINILIERGANLNLKNKSGKTPLHVAALNKSLEVIDLLLKNGANSNFKDNDGNTSLHLAILSNNLFENIKLLINKDFSLHSKDIYGCTPLHYASMHRNKCFILLIEMGANPNCIDYFGRTPLHIVLKQEIDRSTKEVHDSQRCESSYMVEYLLNNGADPNISDKDGSSPSYYAILLDDINIINMLIKNGAKINAFNNKNISPIYLAVMNSKRDIS